MARFSIARLRRIEYGVVISLAIFVAGMAAVSLFAGGPKLIDEVARVPMAVVAGMCALSVVNYIVRFWRWQIFTDRLGLSVPPRRNALYYVAGFAMGTTPGKLGEALRLWLIERCHGARYERVAPLFIADRLADLHAMLLLGMSGLALFPDQRAAALVLAVAALAATVSLIRPALLLRLIGVAHTMAGGRAKRLFARARTAIRLTARLFDTIAYVFPLLLGIAGWSAECLAFAWILAALGSPIGFAASAFVLTFALMIGAASMLPGGLGSAEAAMIALLSVLGVDFDTALLATFIVRLTTLWFGLGLGFLALGPALRLARGDRKARVAREMP